MERPAVGVWYDEEPGLLDQLRLAVDARAVEEPGTRAFAVAQEEIDRLVLEFVRTDFRGAAPVATDDVWRLGVDRSRIPDSHAR